MKDKKIKLILISLFIIIIVSVSMIFIYKNHNTNSTQNNQTTSKNDKIEKKYTVKVYEDSKYISSFTYFTTKKYLGEALLDEGLIEGENGAYGLFITTVLDKKANSSKNEWWKIMVNGQESSTGVDQIEIHNNDTYELILTIGY